VKQTISNYWQKLQNTLKQRKLAVAIGVIILIVLIGVAIEYPNLTGKYSGATQYTTTHNTSSINPPIKTYTSSISPPPSSTSNGSIIVSGVSACSNCYGLFVYTVDQGDTLSLIASHYGLTVNSIEVYNNVSSIYPGEQISLPFYVDTIQTAVADLPNQNTYDYYILSYAVTFHLNPMLIKAEVYDESNFNANAISAHDTSPGVCGTGHSYGLLQYTPTCFAYMSAFGTVQNYVPNAKVLYGQNNGRPVIDCTGACSPGDYFVGEFSDVSSINITSDLVQNQSYNGYNNSVFNPSQNLFTVMQIESLDIQSTVINGPGGCTYAQYNEMALAQYQQSNPEAVFACGQANQAGMTYINSVLSYYQQLTQNAIYGWTDEY
jgi:LysM repeat protein